MSYSDYLGIRDQKTSRMTTTGGDYTPLTPLRVHACNADGSTSTDVQLCMHQQLVIQGSNLLSCGGVALSKARMTVQLHSRTEVQRLDKASGGRAVVAFRTLTASSSRSPNPASRRSS